MVEHPKRGAFADAPSGGIGMHEALSRAREALALINPAPIDAISACKLADDGSWQVTLDVIESAARLGDNDLLTSYVITMKPTGELVDLQRDARFHREDPVSR